MICFGDDESLGVVTCALLELVFLLVPCETANGDSSRAPRERKIKQTPTKQATEHLDSTSQSRQ